MPAITSTDSNFERTFADLSYARLKDKAPSLLNYLVGFQLIDKNDEETHAIGIFGFKVGKEWVYSPMFFINGELKGYELMYLKSQDAFVPLTEEWINYVVHRKPNVLGETEPKQMPELNIRPPDFDVFARPPYLGSKFASVRRPKFSELYKQAADWAKPFYGNFLVSPKDARYNSVDRRFDLPTALRSLGKQAAVNLISTMSDDHKFAEAVLRFYDVRKLIDFEKTAGDIPKADAKYIAASSMRKCRDCSNYSNQSCALVKGEVSPDGSCSYWAAKLGKSSEEVEYDKQEARKKLKAQPVVVVEPSDAVNEHLSDAEKEQVMKGEYVVKDDRTEDQKSIVYDVEGPVSLSSPTQSGLHSLLNADGSKSDYWVFRDVQRVGCSSDSAKTLVVVDKAAKKLMNCRPSSVLSFEMKKTVKELDTVSIDSLADSDVVLFVSPDGEDVIGPGDVYNIVTANGSKSMCVSGANCGPETMLTPTEPPALSRVAVRHIVVSSKSTRSAKVGDTIFLPKSYKVLVIRKGKKSESDKPQAYEPVDSTLPCFEPSGPLFEQIKQSSLRGEIGYVEVHRKDAQYLLRGTKGSDGWLKLAHAVKHLVEKQGFDADDARLCLESTEDRKVKKYWVKGAQMMSGQFTEPSQSVENWTNIPVQYDHIDMQSLSGNLADNKTFYEDPRYVDLNAKSQAVSAANQGQKEVLDTAIISGLIKTVDTDTRVDSYIGDLMLGLDRIGRILFMYYWHNEKFKDRYGQQDMSELEDSLKNTFKGLGELTLFLKQKTIEPELSQGAEAGLTETVE